jgi:hypothetical protein
LSAKVITATFDFEYGVTETTDARTARGRREEVMFLLRRISFGTDEARTTFEDISAKGTFGSANNENKLINLNGTIAPKLFNYA